LDALLKLKIAYLLAINFRDAGSACETTNNRLSTEENENGDDESNDDFGDDTLRIVANVLQHGKSYPE
jgi:hypothetical protein